MDRLEKTPNLVVKSRRYIGSNPHRQKRTFWQWLLRKPAEYKCTYVFEVLFTNEASNYLQVGNIIQLGSKRWIVENQISDIRYTIESITPSRYSVPEINPGKQAFRLYSTAPEL